MPTPRCRPRKSASTARSRGACSIIPNSPSATSARSCGATCHVPYRAEAEAQHFAHRGHARVTLVEAGDLSDEQTVAWLYAGVPRLWASIHIAGGFAFGAIGDTDKALLMRQLDANLVSA